MTNRIAGIDDLQNRRDEGTDLFADRIIQDRSDRSTMLSAFDKFSKLRAGGTRPVLGSLDSAERIVGYQSRVDEPVPPGETSTREPDPENFTGTHSWGGHANGRIAAEELTAVGGGHFLEDAAAQAYNAMVAAAHRDGVQLRLSSSYRSYEAQVDIRKRKGHLVATADPGTSIHGWGHAIDVSGSDAQAWMRRNAARYGWQWPSWAQREGTKSYEPWHFEYRGG